LGALAENFSEAKEMRNPFKRKKKLDELTLGEMVERYNQNLFAREEFHRRQLDQALKLDEKRKQDYIR
jgi:hypothetical protein